uniref:TAR DNA-binding protein 43 n=1 Tax=Lygus hesperus TaxID=30085 RepID=A0A0A9WA35_LYGHE
MDYVLVAESEEEPPIELPLEEDQTLLLTTVDAQFPGASGIKFINPSTGAPRGVRLASKRFHPPANDGGWGDRTYYCVFPKGTEKRKRQVDEEGAPVAKEAKVVPQPKCTDLIVLGLPWETTEENLKKYFEENFGETTLTQIKMSKAGKSRGFGFIRFVDYEVQKKVLSSRHLIDGRWCDVSLPPSARQGSPKVFVGRLTNEIETSHLREYFSTLGEVTDCFIPKPFRGFGFVTFLDPEVAKLACKMENHMVEGVNVHVETASPKPAPNQQPPIQDGRFKGGGRDMRGGGMRDRSGDYGGNVWDYQPRSRPDRFGGGGGGRGDMDRGSSWGQQGGFGRGDDTYLDSGRGGGGGGSGGASGGGINLRGVSPSRLISAIKDAGLADALGLVGSGGGSGGGGYSNRGGFSDDRDMAGNGYGRSYSGAGASRFSTSTSSPKNWGGYDRYDR